MCISLTVVQPTHHDDHHQTNALSHHNIYICIFACGRHFNHPAPLALSAMNLFKQNITQFNCFCNSIALQIARLTRIHIHHK